MRTSGLLGAAAAFAAILVVGFSFQNQARAVPVIVNGGFESASDTGPTGSIDPFITLYASDVSANYIVGWTVTAGSIDWIGNYWQPSQGSRSVDMSGFTDGTIQQLVTGLTINTQYTVFFDLAGNPDSGPETKTLGVMVGVGSLLTPYYFSVAATSKSEMGWITESYTFTATGTATLLTFASLVPGGGGNGYPFAFGPALDNIDIAVASSVSAVPIPAALPLFASGLGALFALGRKKKRAGLAV